MTPELFAERARQWEDAVMGGGRLCAHGPRDREWLLLVPNPDMTPEAVAQVLASDRYEVRLFPLPAPPPA